MSEDKKDRPPVKAKPRYRFVHKFIRNDIPRIYFRRKGYALIPLPGPIGSPEFKLAYAAALNAAPLTPTSALRGGVAARPWQRRPNEAQPLIGVYLLLLKGQIVYIGSSLNMPERIVVHHRNGRPFDQVFYIGNRLSVC
jgi:hypothetical protein